MPTAEQQLANVRKVLPAQFQHRFDRLWRRQRNELLRIVGKPPDHTKVTSQQWKLWEKEQASALLMLMLGYTLMQLNAALDEIDALEMTAVRGEDLKQPVYRSALAQIRHRAKFASRTISKTTRARLRDGSPPDEVMSDSRSRMITATEMTAARSAGVRALFAQLRKRKIDCELVWKLRPCQHCEICPLLDKTPHDFWQQFVPAGPPVHPHCCCQLELVFGGRERLLRQRRITSGPNPSHVHSAIQKSGFKVR